MTDRTDPHAPIPRAPLTVAERAAADQAADEIEDLALDDDYALTAEFVDMVIDAADAGQGERLRELLYALRAEDIADLMGFLSADYREEILPYLDPEDLPEIITELDTNLREEVLEALPSARIAQALGELDTDDAADVVDDMEDEQRDEVLAAMSDVDRAAIETALAYEDETAGRIMQREVLAAPEFWTVGQTIDHVRSADDLPELFFDVYVIDPAFKPLGAIELSRLLRSPRDVSLASLMEAATEIPVDMDQEEVAYTFEKYNLISAPVVDAGGRLVGQITVDDIVSIIHEENEEDILALAGVSDAGRDATVLEIARSRLPWLLVNTITAALAASIIRAFEDHIAQLVTLAVIMPIVASLGGNAGTQSLAVAVRALAGRELNASNAVRIVSREMVVGLINGVVLATVLAAASFAFWHDVRLSATLGAALIINLFLASVVGILAPLTLDKLGRDPAVSSSVFVTFVTDFMGFLSFLGLAALILF